MQHKLFRLFFVLTLVIGLALVPTSLSVRAAGPSAIAYTLTDLGTLGGSDSFPTAINEAGQVIGSSTTPSGEPHAFAWNGGVMTDLGTLGGSYTDPTAINEVGQVIGASYTAGNAEQHAFVWDDGIMTDLGTFGGSYISSYAVAINDAGQIIGYSSTAVEGEQHAFVWEGGVMTDLGTLGGSGSYSEAIAINEAGQIIGSSYTAGNAETHAFVWDGGVMTDLGTFGGSYTYPTAINEAGQIIGSSYTAGNAETHAFVWDGGVMTDLGTFGGSYTFPSAINEADQIAGYSWTAGDAEKHAFVWDDGVMTDLGTFGGSYSEAIAINEAGQVIGFAWTVGNASYHAFVWDDGVMTDLGTFSGGFASNVIAINEAGQVLGFSYVAGDVIVHAFVARARSLNPPANDNFADAEVITSLPFSATADITDATNEGEPGPCYYHMERTVWYTFSPTETTGVSVSTLGGANNRNVNIYRSVGPDISDLIFLDCAIENESSTFVAEFGKTYYLQVGSVFNEVGTIQLNLEPIPSPANDDFVNAVPVPLPLPFDSFVELSAASSQEGEPVPSCASFGLNGTVWYAFRAAESGSISASINGEEHTILAAYTGSSFGDLTEVSCTAPYGGVVTLHVEAGTTYYFQAGNFVSTQSGSMQFHLEVTQPPAANFYYNPGDPSKYDTIQFQDNSYDPGNAGIQTSTWNFGDGSAASGYSSTHKYAADGDYQVTHTVTTVDGRTASIIKTVQVRTHDVAITKIAVPASANVGQTKTITVTLRNIAYPETVQVDLYKSTPNGFEYVGTVTKSVAALSGNRTTSVNFSYKFTSDDARLGKVTFKAIVTINGARDAFPADNEKISTITKVAR